MMCPPFRQKSLQAIVADVSNKEGREMLLKEVRQSASLVRADTDNVLFQFPAGQA